MNDLEFYVDLNNYVYCYDKEVEFFVVFNKRDKQWVKSNISFMQFCHDYENKEINLEKALALCEDIFPDDMYYKYLEMLEKNGGIIKQREIKIFRESNENYKNIVIDLYVDGAKYKSIENNKTVCFKLDFKEHMISCKIEQMKDFKTYELHIPYGIDIYSFILQFEDNELKFV